MLSLLLYGFRTSVRVNRRALEVDWHSEGVEIPGAPRTWMLTDTLSTGASAPGLRDSRGAPTCRLDVGDPERTHARAQPAEARATGPNPCRGFFVRSWDTLDEELVGPPTR